MAYVSDEDKETLQVKKLLLFSCFIFSFITHTLSLSPSQALLSAVVFKLRYDESYNFLNPVRREGGREGWMEGGERGGREEI